MGLTNRQKQIRKDSLALNTERLMMSGIPFESFNNGIHLKVGRFDYYPSTDLFMDSVSGERGRGVTVLINALENKEKKLLWRKDASQ